MVAERTEKTKKRWWVLIPCVMVSVLLLTLCCRCCASAPKATSSESVNERVTTLSEEQGVMAEDMSEKETATEKTSGNQERITESIDVSSELETESREEIVEAETTKEEVIQTLLEETTGEVVTTTEERVKQTGAVGDLKETPATHSTQPVPQTTAAPTKKATESAPTVSVVPTTVANQHSYTGTITKAATCGATGVMTYKCACGHSYTDSIPVTGNHDWVEQTKTVHYDAVTHIVHHEEINHQEWVVDRPAYDEPITETHSFCSGCGKDLTVLEWEIGTTPAEHSLWHIENDGVGYGWHTEQVVVSVIHHEEVGHYKTVVEQPAWDETVVDQPAWDETIVDKEAWDEIVHDCYRCSVCGMTKP